MRGEIGDAARRVDDVIVPMRHIGILLDSEPLRRYKDCENQDASIDATLLRRELEPSVQSDDRGRTI
jgi:hypothetical protein